jgi:hypothetical protein
VGKNKETIMTIKQFKEIGRSLRYIIDENERLNVAREMYSTIRDIKPQYTLMGNRRLTWQMFLEEANLSEI